MPIKEQPSKRNKERMTAVTMEFIDFFKGFKKQGNYLEVHEGIVDTICGCMISKWTSVEFTKVFGIDKDYLQIAIIYIEPFCGYDYCQMYMDFEEVPETIMNLYKLALEHTITKSEDEQQITMYIPYAYNTNRRTVHKTYSASHYYYMIGSTVNLEGLYIDTPTARSRLENVFTKNM